MSFQDFSGTAIHSAGSSLQDPSRAIAASIFQLNTYVKAFVRHVNSVGTSKDTALLRQKLHESRGQISQLSKDISARLKAASEAENLSNEQTNRNLGDGKLARDFHSILTEFQNAQRIEAEKQSILASLPIHDMDESGLSIDALEQQALLNQQRRQDFMLLENEVIFNEAIIEEREQGIKEIQTQIGEVNEIFKDLAMLVHTQGVTIDEIDSNLESTASATTQANVQLAKAETSRKSRSSIVCWLLIIFGSLLLVVIIVVVIRLL